MSNPAQNKIKREARKMLTLIRRELSEVRIFLAILLIIASISVIPAILELDTEGTLRKASSSTIDTLGPGLTLATFILLLFVTPLLSSALAVNQMRVDRGKKTSTFLCTLATSRGRILTARILAGSLMCSFVMVPLLLTHIVSLCWRHPSIAMSDTTWLMGWFLVGITVNLATYSVGLMMGWSKSTWISILGSLGLTAVFVSLLIVKGLSLQTALISLAVATAAFIRVFHRYTSDSLQ